MEWRWWKDICLVVGWRDEIWGSFLLVRENPNDFFFLFPALKILSTWRTRGFFSGDQVQDWETAVADAVSTPQKKDDDV